MVANTAVSARHGDITSTDARYMSFVTRNELCGPVRAESSISSGNETVKMGDYIGEKPMPWDDVGAITSSTEPLASTSLLRCLYHYYWLTGL